MIEARTIAEVREATERMRRAGERIAFVPTMGALHRGHLSLLERAAERADRTVLSIFVNPIQFGPDEDLERYPRDLEHDLELARSHDIHLVFAPAREEIYPDGPPRITVDPGAMADRLCGAFRPGHFRGVLTVVSKLFSIVRPRVAVFGQKDFQQWVLVRRMVEDLNLGVEIDVAPIVREDDGLAMSSRNALLSRDERTEAAGIHRALRSLENRFREGEVRVPALLEAFADDLRPLSGLRLQYAEIVDPGTLERLEVAGSGDVVAVAVYAGETRLIDNLVLDSEGRAVDPDAIVRAAGEAVFPSWTRADANRRAHMLRVASLMGDWAAALGKQEDEVRRWKAAGLLHDTLRDEEPEALRSLLLDARPELADLPAPLLHGPAAGVRLMEEGVSDDELIEAVTYHTTGHPGMGELGRALYAADFLEPGRTIIPGWRNARRLRMPMALNEVVREILDCRIDHLREGQGFVRPETRAFSEALSREAAAGGARPGDEP